MDDLAAPYLDHLNEAWESLPQREQRVLWHVGVLGVPAGEVAEAVGIPAGTVGKILEGARMELGVRYREIVHRETSRPS